MAYFQTKNQNLCIYQGDLLGKMLVYFVAIWSILQPFGIFCGHLVYIFVIWYICGIFYGYLVYFSRFGILYQEKSGNPARAEPTEIIVFNFFAGVDKRVSREIFFGPKPSIGFLLI
jgi:hypothetical protein